MTAKPLIDCTYGPLTPCYKFPVWRTVSETNRLGRTNSKAALAIPRHEQISRHRVIREGGERQGYATASALPLRLQLGKAKVRQEHE